MLVALSESFHNDFVFQESGINLLSLRAPSAEKYALAMMDALFRDEQMCGCCFMSTVRSTKPPLPQADMELI